MLGASLCVGEIVSAGRALGRADRRDDAADAARRRCRRAMPRHRADRVSRPAHQFAAFGQSATQAAAAFLRAGIGRDASLALYLPNTPYHPVAFFGEHSRGARLVHLEPARCGARACPQAQGQRRAHHGDHQYRPDLLPMALRLLDAGLVDRVIVGDDAAWGPEAVPIPTVPIPERRGRDRVVGIRRWRKCAACVAESPAV